MKDKLKPLPMAQVTLTGGLLAQKQRINAAVTAPLLYRRCDETGRVAALYCRWDGKEESRPHPFWDSDIGKTIESIAYTLRDYPSEELQEQVDALTSLLERAQQPDGYLNTYFLACEREESRFQNLYYMHELYCAGHLIEGAVAYFWATGKRKLLDILCRYADLLCRTFGPKAEQCHGYCGHPEIELALVRLYEATGEMRYLSLSKYFIDQRGTTPYFFEEESLKRGVDTTKTANQKRHLKHYLNSRGPYAEYQAHLPVREQREPVGHAVRAMYLYSGMADIARECEDGLLYAACTALWQRLCSTQLYITGGIGPSSDGERFTFAYDLPNEYTYNESCASVALMMFARRMLCFGAESCYSDVLEQVLYNVLLGSVSMEGDRFFYANYLSVNPQRFQHASRALIDKMYAQRQSWFDVSCCPPNISRLLGSLGEYLSSYTDGAVYFHLYTQSTQTVLLGDQPVTFEMQTNYPWEGEIVLSVDCAVPTKFSMHLRIPGWCQGYTLLVNGERVLPESTNGYCTLSRLWQKGDCVVLSLCIEPFWVQADPRVRENCGKVALQRGPLVYCVEQADNGENLMRLAAKTDTPLTEKRGISGLLEEGITISFEAEKAPFNDGEALYQRLSNLPPQKRTVTAVPYFLWGHRGFGEMEVWIRKA